MEPNNPQPIQNNFVPPTPPTPTPTPAPAPTPVSTFVPPARPAFVPPGQNFTPPKPPTPPTPPAPAPVKVAIPTAPIAPAPNVPHHNNLKAILIGILLLFVVIGGIWIFYNQSLNGGVDSKLIQKINTAPDGQLVPEFPRELILDPDAKIQGSGKATIDNPEIAGFEAVFAKYSTNISEGGLLKLYSEYLARNGYAEPIITPEGEKSFILTSTGKVNTLVIQIIRGENNTREVGITIKTY
jgi:hypothetical protein